MPVVPFSKTEPRIDDSLMPSDTHLAMAAAMMQQAEAAERAMFEYKTKPYGTKTMIKDPVERKRAAEENPDITKYPARTIEPGEEAIDRERGLDSNRVIKRL